MENVKNWVKKKKHIVIILLVALVSGYYVYLTQVSRVFLINETYYASDEYSSVALEFDGEKLSAYFLYPSSEIIALRVDYQIDYRTYTKDFIGNFWGNNGIQPFALRGADVAGNLYAECTGCVLWADEVKYYSKEDILAMEKSNEEDYSFASRFFVKDNILRIYNYSPLDFQSGINIPAVDAEIMRIMDSLCPPKYDRLGG